MKVDLSVPDLEVVKMKCRRRKAKSRHALLLFAILQKRDLYEKQLRKFQATLRCPALPWREVKKCSSPDDLESQTLYVKSQMNDPVGIEKRILSKRPVVRNAKSNTMQSSTAYRDSQADENLTSSTGQNKKFSSQKYNTQGIDGDSESDEDFSSYKKTSKKNEGPKFSNWLLERLNKASSQKKLKQKLRISNNNCSKEETDKDKDENMIDEKDQKNKKSTVETPENREAGLLSGVKTGLSKVLTKIATGKGSKKKDFICVEENEDDSVKENGHDNQEILVSVPKKKQKKEEAKFECPLCSRKFNEEEINEHAFTCNGEQQNTTRNQKQRLDQSMDYIPLGAGSSFVKGQHKSSNGNAENAFDYTEWENACQKVDMGKRKNVQMSQLLKGNNEARYSQSYFKQMCMDSEKICNDQPSKNIKERVVKEKEKASLDEHKEIANWISGDSDSQDANKSADFLHQYLNPEQIVPQRKKRRIRINRRKRQRAAILDDDDSMGNGDDMEKCFICSKMFPTGTVYNAHVNECVSREEAKNGEEADTRTEGNQSIGRKSEDQDGLHKRLGNRESWAPFEKAEHADEEIVDSVDDDKMKPASPVQTYKPVSETSLFNFDNQFKNNSNPRNKLPTKTYLKRKKRF